MWNPFIKKPPKDIGNKKRAIILVEIDPDAQPGTSCSTVHAMGNRFMCKVTVVRDSLQPDAPLIGLAAHELGHTLAGIFRTDKAMATVAQKLSGNNLTTERTIEAEEEAWDLAEQMVGGDNLETKEVDLDSYRNGQDTFMGWRI